MQQVNDPAELKARYYVCPQVYGIEFMQATFLKHSFARHSHDYFALGVIEKGVQTFSCGPNHYETPAGGIFVINPGEPHTGETITPGGFSYSVFYPSAQLFEKVASEITGRQQTTPFFANPRLDDPLLSKSLSKLARTLIEAKSALEGEHCLLETFGLLVRRHAANRYAVQQVRRERAAVRQVREYLESNYSENISLTALGEQVALSPFYLARVFRADTGMPPHIYLENVRVQRAQQLIAQGLPLAQVAQETGFSHQSHLTNCFKRFIGISPGQFAQRRKLLQDFSA
jgi:AraC-like DNA-binding protein